VAFEHEVANPNRVQGKWKTLSLGINAVAQKVAAFRRGLDVGVLDKQIKEYERKIGRAEALRKAMLANMNDCSDPRNAYPAFWGPFALIGDGAAR
jgi:hypothetical protein